MLILLKPLANFSLDPVSAAQANIQVVIHDLITCALLFQAYYVYKEYTFNPQATNLEGRGAK